MPVLFMKNKLNMFFVRLSCHSISKIPEKILSAYNIDLRVLLEAVNHLRWSSLSKRRSYHKAKLVFSLSMNTLPPSFFGIFHQIFDKS